MLDSATEFHAPELLTSVVVQSNLRSLYALDSWAVGVLIAMIAGGMNKSPFCAEVDWSAGLFTPEAATRAAIFNTQRTLADFLLEVDGGAGGFLFRNGWVVRLLIGLLQVEPSRRMPVYQAYRIAHDAIDSNPQYADEQRPESTRTAAANQPPAAVAEPTKADADSAAAVPAPGAASSAPAVTPESGRTPTQTKGSTGAKSAAPSPRRGDGRPNTVEGDASTLGLELSRFRKLATTSSSSEPFRSLEAVLNIGSRGGAYVTIQKREWEDVKNYGEVIGFRNRADGDRWDVFVPGLEKALPEGEPYKLRNVMGVVLIKGGNHKLVVEIEDFEPISKERVAADIKQFVTTYARVHRGVQASRVRYLALDELDF